MARDILISLAIILQGVLVRIDETLAGCMLDADLRK